MSANNGLSLAETIRIKIAFGGGLRLDLNRDDAIMLLRIIEREERVMRQCEQLEDAAEALRYANERTEVMMADLRAERDSVGDPIGSLWRFVAIVVSVLSIVLLGVVNG